MRYTSHYASPLGGILMAADAGGLTGLWFDGAKYCGEGLEKEPEAKELPVFEQTRCWLDLYFTGQEPDFMPGIHMMGTPFQLEVWELLRQIPYGGLTTYGAIARTLAARRGRGMSAQAVGGAVGHNRISILIPCHRVVGAGGVLTGYAGGLEKKRALLRLEGADVAL